MIVKLSIVQFSVDYLQKFRLFLSPMSISHRKRIFHKYIHYIHNVLIAGVRAKQLKSLFTFGYVTVNLIGLHNDIATNAETSYFGVWQKRTWYHVHPAMHA